MKTKNKLSLVAGFFLLLVSPQAGAQLSYSVADLGTLGGATSTASGVTGGQGHNAAGMIVGSSMASDNSEHAFLYTNGQMFDLNTLCDLSASGFSVLTVAKTISDSCLIIGEGITNKGEKHAFLLTPLAVDGGQWSYVCCQWVWIQTGGGWWWETGCGCYRWHGPPKGKRPPCPPQPPHCWWFPLPCPPECGCTPPERETPPPTRTFPPRTATPTQPPQTATPTFPPTTQTATPPIRTFVPGVITQTATPGGFFTPGIVSPTQTPGKPFATGTVTPTPNQKVTPTSTPLKFYSPGVLTATATPHKHATATATPKFKTNVIKAEKTPTPTPSRRRISTKTKKASPTPTPTQIR